MSNVPADEIAIACKGFKICRRQTRAVLKTLRERAPWKFPAGALSVAFVDDAKTCELHEEFLNDPSKTDVITFPGDEIFSVPERREILSETPARKRVCAKKSATENCEEISDAFAGEIVVCVDQAMRAAVQFGTSPADEILLYLVHGWLHLAGLDDLTDAARVQMRAAETEAIAILRECGVAPFTRISFPPEK